jgi:hypothetical protein
MKQFLVLIGALFACLIAAPDLAFAAPEESSAKVVTMDSCLQECRKCFKICEQTLAYCQTKGGKHADKAHLKTLKDCIAACKLSADFLSRGSQNHAKSCEFCAEICRACATSCDSFSNDKKMKDCAAACRQCAESCEAMVKQMSQQSIPFPPETVITYSRIR